MPPLLERNVFPTPNKMHSDKFVRGTTAEGRDVIAFEEQTHEHIDIAAFNGIVDYNDAGVITIDDYEGNKLLILNGGSVSLRIPHREPQDPERKKTVDLAKEITGFEVEAI